MRKTDKRKLTLSKETIASLEAGKMIEVAGGADNTIEGLRCYTNYTCPNTR